MAVNQAALGTLDAKQQQQVKAALAKKAAGQVLGPGQRAALKAYNAALTAAGGKPTVGIGAGNAGVKAPSPANPVGTGPRTLPGGGGGGGSEPSWMLNAQGRPMNIDDIIADPTRLAAALSAAGISGGSLEEQLRNAMLGYSFAGVNQYRSNLSGDFGIVQNDPSLQNVGLDTDINSLRRIVGEIAGAFQEGDPAKVQASWAKRLGGVPQWAPNVYGDIGSQDTHSSLLGSKSTGSSGTGGWTLEQLASPDINLFDPSQPLFGPDAHPQSLQQLTGYGAGEEAFYRGLSAEEFLRGIQPLYNQYYNRAPGAPPPNAGLMFGVDPGMGSAAPFDEGYAPAYWDHPIRSPRWQYALTEDPTRGGANRFGIAAPGYAADVYGSGLDALSPAERLYGRWSALGMPGDYTMNGTLDLSTPWGDRAGSFSPMTGQGSYSFGGRLGMLNDWIDGTIPPGYLGAFEGFAGGWGDMSVADIMEWNPAAAFAGYPGMAAALGRPDIYWSMPWAAPFGPGGELVSQEAYDRLLAVMAQAMEPTEVV